jgi:thioredoxin-dependent peroxiredoxin
MEAYRDQYATIFNNGNKVTLVGISVDPDTMLASWAREKQLPFWLAHDEGGRIGRLYAAYDTVRKQNSRIVVVIGPDGIITEEFRPFRVLAGEPYAQLDSAIDRATLRVRKDGP